MNSKSDDLKGYLDKATASFPVRNQANVTKYQHDICETLGVGSVWFDQASKKIPNQHFVDWLWGDHRDYVESLGLLNRGFCPICGDEPIDKTYCRRFTFGNAVEYMCADCFKRMNDDAEAFKAFLPPGYKRRYYTYTGIKWLLIAGVLIGVFYLVRACVRLF
jgi:hypothetical protein